MKLWSMTRNMWFIDCWVYNVWHLFLLPLGGVWSRDIRLHCCCWALTLNWQAITNVSPRLFLLTVKCISSSSSQHIEQSPSAVCRWNGMKWATPYDVLLESFLPGPSPEALCVVTVIISLHVAYIQWETDKAGREKERKRMEKRIGDGDAPPVPYSKFDDADDSQQMLFSQRTTTQGPERHQLGDEAAFLFFLSCTVYRPTHTHIWANSIASFFFEKQIVHQSRLIESHSQRGIVHLLSLARASYIKKGNWISIIFIILQMKLQFHQLNWSTEEEDQEGRGGSATGSFRLALIPSCSCLWTQKGEFIL